jgi:hypothetical protein
MAKNEDTQFRAQAQSQDLTERLSIARDAAMQGRRLSSANSSGWPAIPATTSARASRRSCPAS